MNEPARGRFGEPGIMEGGSLLVMLIGEDLPRRIENWPEVAHRAAQRLRTESASQGGVSRLDRAAEKLAATPGRGETHTGPVAPAIYRSGTTRLSLFAIIAQFGTPDDLTIDDLKIELFFPADAETDQALRAMSAQER